MYKNIGEFRPMKDGKGGLVAFNHEGRRIDVIVNDGDTLGARKGDRVLVEWSYVGKTMKEKRQIGKILRVY